MTSTGFSTSMPTSNESSMIGFKKPAVQFPLPLVVCVGSEIQAVVQLLSHLLQLPPFVAGVFGGRREQNSLYHVVHRSRRASRPSGNRSTRGAAGERGAVRVPSIAAAIARTAPRSSPHATGFPSLKYCKIASLRTRSNSGIRSGCHPATRSRTHCRESCTILRPSTFCSPSNVSCQPLHRPIGNAKRRGQRPSARSERESACRPGCSRHRPFSR